MHDVRRAWTRLAPVALALVVAGLYAPTLGNGLTNWDDPAYVQNNPFAQRGLVGVALAFFGSHEHAYYPVTHAIYALIQASFGTSPLAHHLVQVLLFSFGVALLPWALGAFGVSRTVGIGVALVWAAHPMRVESVSWVAGLKDTTSFFFLVLAFGLHGTGRRNASMWSFAAALLSKSAIFPVAGLFVVLEARGRGFKAGLGRGWPWVLLGVGAAAIGVWLHVLPSEEMGRSLAGEGIWASLPSALFLPWWYAWRTLSLAPPQSVFAFEALGWGDPRFWTSALAWSALLVWALAGAGDTRWKRMACLLGWALPFAPVTGMVPLAHTVADRYAFLPSIAGLLALVAVGRAAVMGGGALAARLPLVGGVVAVGAAGILAKANVPRQLEYRDSVSLWRADLPREPDHWVVHFNLAGALGGEGRWREASSHLHKAEQIRPEMPLGAWLLFAKLVETDLPPEQIISLTDRLRGSGEARDAWFAIAKELAAEQAIDAARVVMQTLLEREPSAEAYLMAAMVEGAAGHREWAVQLTQHALEVEPFHGQALLLRASLLLSLGWDEAVLDATALEIPNSRERAFLARSRGTALLRLGRIPEAIDALTVAVEPEHRPILAETLATARSLQEVREVAGDQGMRAQRAPTPTTR